MKKAKKQPTRTKRQTKAVKKTGFRAVLHRSRFLPAIGISLFAGWLTLQPYVAKSSQTGEVLAYATNVSVSGLLASTNQQRANNGVAALGTSGLLNSAAQAKANDMVNRNYWSHETPDGKQPWVFITNAGYQYTSAGENLAYGYMSSGDTVVGWMNSAPHRQNLLSAGFTEVGFGIANSVDYVSAGEQTVVVAMYAKPQAAAAPVATKPAATKPSTTAPVAKTPTPEPTAEPVETPPAAEIVKEEPIAVSDNEQTIVATAAPVKTRRIQILTDGRAIWSVTGLVLALGAAGTLWVLHHALRVRRWMTAGEYFIAHHIHLDLTVLAIVFLATVLLSTSGTIR